MAFPVRAGAHKGDSRKRAAAVTVNTTQPANEPAPAMPVFSASPSDAEITKARVFEEPLVRMAKPHGITSGVREIENNALKQAITVYLERNDPEDVSPFTLFLNQYPRSSWRVSLLTKPNRHAIGVATYPDGRRIAFENTGYQTPEGKWILSKVPGTERNLPINREQAEAWVKELPGDLSQNAMREIVEMLCEVGTQTDSDREH